MKLELKKHPETGELIPEEWKPIKGFEKWYEISNYGRAKSWKNGRWGRLEKPTLLRTPTNKRGYPNFNMHKDSRCKRTKVHRMVGIHFIENPDNKPCINHKDGNKENNFYLNLEWCTYKENIDHALDNKLINIRGENSTTAKLRREDVFRIREMYKSGEYYQRDLADMFGVARTQISRIVNRKRWSHI